VIENIEFFYLKAIEEYKKFDSVPFAEWVSELIYIANISLNINVYIVKAKLYNNNL